jgi:hypothetical protein
VLLQWDEDVVRNGLVRGEICANGHSKKKGQVDTPGSFM